jgi:hypothetical protein
LLWHNPSHFRLRSSHNCICANSARSTVQFDINLLVSFLSLRLILDDFAVREKTFPLMTSSLVRWRLIGVSWSLVEESFVPAKASELACVAGGCARLHWLAASNNKIEGIPDSFRMLKCLRGLILDDNRVASVPSIVLKECLELHTLSIRANPITMEQLRAVDGFEELAQRRKGMLDKVVDAKLGANFTEAADYSQGS